MSDISDTLDTSDISKRIRFRIIMSQIQLIFDKTNSKGIISNDIIKDVTNQLMSVNCLSEEGIKRRYNDFDTIDKSVHTDDVDKAIKNLCDNVTEDEDKHLYKIIGFISDIQKSAMCLI